MSHRLLPGLIALAGVMSAAASAGAIAASSDPLQSPACLRALADLDTQERAAAQRPAMTDRSGAAVAPTLPPRWSLLRAVAARACLGADPDATPPAGRAQAPVVLMPAQALPRAGPATLPSAPVQIAPPIRSEPLKSVTLCDAAGCWASDGSRLQRLGPNLVGPKGFCSVHGGVLSCP